ncbi:MAG: peptidoglycan DD-metalloendopeptidase family protein [Anaerolineae bacterium]
MAFRMRWPTQYDGITQAFGARPEYYGKFGLPGHEGLDFRAPEGSEIYAVADGFVTEVRLDGNSDPAGKPYGNQVRIQHEGGYLTIYAHLSKVLVAQGQTVQAGQVIGLSGTTGNTSGAHLHLTLKKEGATEAGETTYPYDIIDPSPYLDPFTEPEPPEPPAEATMDVEVFSPEVGYLNVRAAPHAGAEQIARVDHGALLGSLEPEEVTHAKLGQVGQWLWVRIPGGQVGYVAAWYLRLPEEEEPLPEPVEIIFITVDSPELPLKLRTGPGTDHPILTEMEHGTVLKALESEGAVRAKLGAHGAWLRVRTPEGTPGYAAAWYLKAFPTPPPVDDPIREDRPVRYVQVESPNYGLRVRSGPGTEHDQVWWVAHGTVLESLEQPRVTADKIGTEGAWIRVRTPARKEGFVAAWYVQRPEGEDERQSVERTQLPLGVSPYIFGMHAAQLSDDPHMGDSLRALFESGGRKGWILFTEALGHNPDGISLNPQLRDRLWRWIEGGYGVIVRLNNGYHPNGTLPESEHYEAFADTCTRWVSYYLTHENLEANEYTITVQIGNEQNNPSEHPGGLQAPREHITPELYAIAFNHAYRHIKAVLPNAIICPGAVDPYNSSPMKLLGNARWRPLEYFEQMLNDIDALDGIVLHAYTHGPSVEAITHLSTFHDPFLGDHYFNFQTYRLFMERIPKQWRQTPVYITETNHICRPPSAPACDRPEHQGWINANIGWVRQAYSEVDSWNEQPHLQQIRALLLYRWLGDQWALHDKPAIQEDFRQAMEADYRWRAPLVERELVLTAMAAGEEAFVHVTERNLAQPDNLRIIWGIGPKTVALLRAAGIVLFEQLAAMRPSEIKRLLGETGIRTRAVESWPEQARLAAQHDWQTLFEYQASMGRHVHHPT